MVKGHDAVAYGCSDAGFMFRGGGSFTLELVKRRPLKLNEQGSSTPTKEGIKRCYLGASM